MIHAGHWSEQRLCSHSRCQVLRWTLSNGVEQVATGCIDCGKRTGQWLAHAEHPNRATYPLVQTHPDPCDCHDRARSSAIARLQQIQQRDGSPPRWNRDAYDQYLASAEWAERRRYFLSRAMHRCQLCKTRGAADGRGLDVHHSDYSRLGAELEIDVIVLCRRCHAHHHGHIGQQAA